MRRVVAVHSDRLHPSDLWLGELSDGQVINWRQLTRFNPIVEETVRLAPAERFPYEGADGWHIDAVLTLPTEPKRGSPPPVVVDVHGGPTFAWRDDWRSGSSLPQVLAAAGFAVFQPNPRGSVGRVSPSPMQCSAIWAARILKIFCAASTIWSSAGW